MNSEASREGVLEQQLVWILKYLTMGGFGKAKLVPAASRGFFH